MSKVKKVFVLSQFGTWTEDYSRRKSGLVGVYTQKHQLYKAMMVLCNYQGNLNDYDNAVLPGTYMPDGKEVTYRRLCNAIAKPECRVQLSDHDEEPFYNIWECPLNHIPNIFQEEDASEAWWDKKRFRKEEDDEEGEDGEEN